jgi:hypothetical protein
MALAIAKVRQAVEQLCAADKDVTLRNIQELLAVTRGELNSALRINGLKKELSILSLRDACRVRFKTASDRLVQLGIPVTAISLASQMNRKIGSVRMWIMRNKTYCAELGVVSGYKANIIKRTSKYKAAVEQLRAKNQPVTKTAIADLTYYDRELVCRDFGRNPSLAVLLLTGTEHTESA